LPHFARPPLGERIAVKLLSLVLQLRQSLLMVDDDDHLAMGLDDTRRRDTLLRRDLAAQHGVAHRRSHRQQSGRRPDRRRLDLDRSAATHQPDAVEQHLHRLEVAALCFLERDVHQIGPRLRRAQIERSRPIAETRPPGPAGIAPAEPAVGLAEIVGLV
jgi:hypothetical protein